MLKKLNFYKELSIRKMMNNKGYAFGYIDCSRSTQLPLMPLSQFNLNGFQAKYSTSTNGFGNDNKNRLRSSYCSPGSGFGQYPVRLITNLEVKICGLKERLGATNLHL